MKKERIVLSSKSVELSEHKTYLLLENRICYYGEPNANGVSLSVETAEQYAQTLVDMPVYAKYVPNINGDPSFGGHESYIDEDGEVAFDTMPIGVHTSVNVRTDLVETAEGQYRELPCLFATQKIWTRNKNIVAAVKRLFSEGKLYNSWEISYDTCRYLAGGTKELIDYTFEGNCFLGVDNYNYPAYGPDACVISLSALQNSEATMLVATAAAKDFAENEKKDEGGEILKIENENVTIDPEETSSLNDELTHPEDIVESEEIETQVISEETTSELEKLDSEASDNSKDEEEESNDNQAEVEVRLSEIHGELIIEDTGAEVTDPNTNIDNLCNQIAELTKALSEANDKIESLNSELEKYHEAEKKVRIAELKKYVQDSGYFSEEEIETEEISNLIQNLDKASLAEKIADRAVESVRLNRTSTYSSKITSSMPTSVIDDGIEDKTHNKDYRVIIDSFFMK